MPVVPSYRRQVSPQALPAAQRTATATLESSGAALSEAQSRKALVGVGVLNRLTDQAIGIYARQQAEARRLAEEAKRRADELAVTRGGVEMGQNDLELGTAALQVHGEATLQSTKPLLDEYEKRAEAISARLTPDQRDAFEIVRAHNTLRFQGKMYEHQFQEMQKFEVTEYEAAILTHNQLAAFYAGDAQRAADELGFATTAAESLARVTGAGKEKTAAIRLDATTRGHTGVIRELLASGEAVKAQDYFTAAYKAGEIEETVAAEIKTRLKAGTTLKKSQEALDIITAKTKDYQARLDLAKTYFSAKEDPDGTLRDTLEKLIDHKDAQQTKIDYDLQQRARKTLIDTIDAAGTDTTKVISLENLMKMPEYWQLDSPEARKNIELYQKEKLLGRDPVTDEKQFTKLRDLAESDQNTFAWTIHLDDDKWRLSKADHRYLHDLQLQIRQGTRGAAVESAKRMDGYDSKVTGVFNNSWTFRTGETPSLSAEAVKNDPAKAQRYAAMRRVVAERVARELRPDATTQDVQRVVDSVFLSSMQTTRAQAATTAAAPPSARRGFGELQPVAGYSADQAAATPAVRKNILDLTYKDIPAFWVKYTVDALVAQGRPIDNASVLAEFLYYVGSGKRERITFQAAGGFPR